MPGAARIGDATNHPGTISGGLPNVLIEGRFAARVGDMHTCAFPPPAGPHPSNVIASGSPTVLIGGLPAARQGDSCACGAQITSAALTVIIG